MPPTYIRRTSLLYHASYAYVMITKSCSALLHLAANVFSGYLNYHDLSGVLETVSLSAVNFHVLDSILHHVPPTVNDELADLSGAARALPFPSHVQCYWKTPKVLGYFMDLVIFIFLGLSGLSAVLGLALPT